MEKATSTHEEQRRQEEVVSSTETAGPVVHTRGRVAALVAALRPRQWIKNLVVFIGLVFAERLFDLLSLERTILAFLIFCLASSCVYLFNDLADLENDRQHPVKCKRPLASGQLPISWAIAAMVGALLLEVALLGVLFTLPTPPHDDMLMPLGGANVLFSLTIACYLVLMVLYTLRLKHVVLIDVFVIASGFVLRIIAGTVVVPIFTSPWLYMVTCFLSLFLALSKRRNELVLLQGRAGHHRQILKEYSIPLLNQMITIAVSATIMAYSLYTIEGPAASRGLMITIPLVLYGVFRYLYLMYMRMEGGSPEEVLLRDRPMLGTVMACTIMIILVLYVIPRL